MQGPSSLPCLPPLDNSSSAPADCLLQGGSFFDACSWRCEREMGFLRLNKDLQLENFVYGYVFPGLVLLVVVANLLVALVLSQRHMLSPTNLVLKYMAIADLCVGLSPLPWNFFYHTLRHFEREQEELHLWWCYAYKYSMDAIPPVCHNIAMWLTVLLAGQRYLSIRHPINSRQLCSIRNVRIATVLITVSAIVCGLPKCVDYHFAVYDGWAYVDWEDQEQWVRIRTCLSGFTFFVTMVGSNTFFNAYFWTRVVGFILVPSLLLICLNALLILSIQKAQIRKARLLKEKRAREAQRQTDSNSTSAMLVIVVSIFLLVNLPQALFMAILTVYNTLGLKNDILEGQFTITFLLVSNMLVMATYPINFGIYCFMSSSFRDTFRMLLFSRKGLPRRALGSRRAPSLGGQHADFVGAPSEVTRLSLVRRSTDPSSHEKRGRAELRPSCSPSRSSLLSEIPSSDPPQRSKNAANGQLPEGKEYLAKMQSEEEETSGAPLSPTRTLLEETVFL